MLTEVVDAFVTYQNGVFLDGTLGLGGHAEAILEAYGGLDLLGIDLDLFAIGLAEKRLQRFEGRVNICQGSYVEMASICGKEDISDVSGVLLDLGISSLQIETPDRGFSFRNDALLDMRFGQTGEITASDIVNRYKEEEIADLIYQYGEERRSRRIAAAIVRQRPLETTGELARVIETALGRNRGRIHPATRTFQALRIAVNGELENVRRGIQEAINILKPSARLVVISYHSLEDRIVKRFFKQESNYGSDFKRENEEVDRSPRTRLITKKVVKPSREETQKNPRSRSAKLRIVERI
jgi:16S rRNA (cytosine1402-N4)-methyltransferase